MKVTVNNAPPAFKPIEVTITLENEIEKRKFAEALRHYGIKHMGTAPEGLKLVEIAEAVEGY